MSDSPDSAVPPPEHASAPRRTMAVVRRSWWPAWIWAVPIAAVGVMAWLMVRAVSARGTHVVVSFDDASGLQADSTKVLDRGVTIGEVSKVELSDDRRHVLAHLHIDDRVKGDINSGTRFYLENSHPSLSDPASLKAIIAGPTLEMVPGPGTPVRRFVGILGSPPPSFAARVPYLISLPGDVGALAAGAPVTLRGFRVGVVTDVELRVEARTGAVSTPVKVDLDPTRFHLDARGANEREWTAILNATLARMVAHDFRARLAQTPPLVGEDAVALEFVADAPPATLRTDTVYPEIPAVEAGGFAALPRKLDELPLTAIGQNVRSITEHVRGLVASPHLERSLEHLDRTLAEVDTVAHTAGPEIAPTLVSVRATVDSLRKTAIEMDAAALEMRRMVGSRPDSPDGNLQRTLYELTGTARAVRTLADYLDQHPEALIKGR